MDLFLLIGILVGGSAVVVGMVVKGADVSVLMNPAAAIIIMVGTMAAVMNSFPKKEFLNIPRILAALFRVKAEKDPAAVVLKVIEMSQRARKDGLLALEQDIQTLDDEFIKKGLTMIVDGTEAEYVREVLDHQIDSTEERHRAGASVFTSAGSYAPTLGVLGAVIGLIGALGNLHDVEKLGHMIAAAFVATLYGIFFGYVICHPIATRLKRKSHEELSYMRIVVEGVLSIQAGENPQSIKMKLSGLLDPKDRIKLEKSIEGSDAKGAA